MSDHTDPHQGIPQIPPDEALVVVINRLAAQVHSVAYSFEEFVALLDERFRNEKGFK